jgi:pimeloyl-ACP methyl ester carboxylesterase
MTLSELQAWRKKVPWLVSLLCAVPWLLLRTHPFSGSRLTGTLFALTVALITPIAYVLLDLRERRWSRENDEHVGAQIKRELIALVPEDIHITPGEREQLIGSEIYKKLTGVFWEALDQSEVMRAQKEHFYSNGFEYSSAIDIFLLLRFFGLCYVLVSVVLRDFPLFCVGGILILAALFTRWLGVPRARRRHLALSSEQLDWLKREKGQFVRDRFRTLVQGWRDSTAAERPSISTVSKRRTNLIIPDVVTLACIALIAVVGIATGRWTGSTDLDGLPPEIRSSYIGDGTHKKPVVVVFVHGIFGTKQDTWLNQGSGGSFPDLLATDPELKDRVDVFAFEYFTPKWGAAPSIVDLADQLRGELNDHHVYEDHQKVVFVAHSMGGIIVRQFLLNHQDRIPQVPMIFFYATPTNGSELASLAEIASDNPQLRGMKPIEGNDLLQSIQSMWLSSKAAKSIASYCGVEELPTSGVMVVTRSSATSMCNRDLDPFSANHIDIVKPTDRSDPRYAHFATALQAEALGPN